MRIEIYMHVQSTITMLVVDLRRIVQEDDDRNLRAAKASLFCNYQERVNPRFALLMIAQTIFRRSKGCGRDSS
jgi:hypothetical protein